MNLPAEWRNVQLRRSSLPARRGGHWRGAPIASSNPHGRLALPVLLSLGRIFTAGGLLARPHQASRAWLGVPADGPAIAAGARMLAARELALGVGPLLALRQGEALAPWLVSGALADGMDFVTTMPSAIRTRNRYAIRTLVVAAGSVALHVALVAAERRRAENASARRVR